MTPESFDTLGGVELSHASSNSGSILERVNSPLADTFRDESPLAEFPLACHGDLTRIHEPPASLSMALDRGAQASARKRRRGIGSLGGAEA